MQSDCIYLCVYLCDFVHGYVNACVQVCVSMHGKCVCVSAVHDCEPAWRVYVCEYIRGVRPEGCWELLRLAEGHAGMGSDKIKGRIGMGSPRGAGEDGLEGPVVQG